MWKFILLGVLLFLLWLMVTKLSLQLLYTDQFYVYLKVYFLRFRLSPKKQRVNLKQFSAKGIKQKLNKDKQKQIKEQHKKRENGSAGYKGYQRSFFPLFKNQGRKVYLCSRV